MIKVGIVGGTGYTGVELLRLLVGHPDVSLGLITSRGAAGQRVDELFPNLRGHCGLTFSEPDDDALAGCDVVFYATPHNVAMHSTPGLLARGVKVIDLSADFRLRNADEWARWYGAPHACPDLLPRAVYGLPEINRDPIASADLIACPGCYPTSVLLGFAPLLRAGVVDLGCLVANAASGVSGAGRQPSMGGLLAEASDNFNAYGVDGHRHLPEIEQGLSDIVAAEAGAEAGAGEALRLTFVPHLLPMIRGIHSTLYARLLREVDLQGLYEDFYRQEPFVDVLPPGQWPQTRSVRGSNVCRLAVARPQGRDMAVVMVVEDNLVKGAAGQAVQAMNVCLGLDEGAGLGGVGLLP